MENQEEPGEPKRANLPDAKPTKNTYKKIKTRARPKRKKTKDDPNGTQNDVNEDLIEEVYQEVINNPHPLPKIKFNFSIKLTAAQKESCNIVNQPNTGKNLPTYTKKESSNVINQPSTSKNPPISTKKELSNIVNQPSTSKNPPIIHTEIFINSNLLPTQIIEEKDNAIPVDENSKTDIENNETPNKKIPVEETHNGLPDISNKNSAATKKKKKKSSKKSEKKNLMQEAFEPYLSEEEIVQGLSSGTMIMGHIRINPKNYREAYVSLEETCNDILVDGIINRNRAMEGDKVVLSINNGDDRKNCGGVTLKTGKVVRIMEYVHPRTCVGALNLQIGITNVEYYLFSPKDPRVPRLKIQPETIPAVVIENPEDYQDMIWYASIDDWPEVNFGTGTILKMIGTSGDLESETTALMLEYNLDAEPIPSDFEVYYPRMPFTIPTEEFDKRTDLRKKCIFTIDPATARDLDDAVSCEILPNGNLEVGVHISDVTYFLKQDTLLDDVVSKRATTVYLVQRVYHMLPVELCQLCSLTPGEDKVAFSVIFEMTPDAVVVNQTFCRSVIQSCSKFAYEHAQLIIDNPDKEWTREDFPQITNGFGPADCVQAVTLLYQLSLLMRERRFSTGALRLDVPKLCFSLDHETNRPISCFIYENKESHRLIEEFMLLANMSVAEHIYELYPDLAFLRNHPPPNPRLMIELQEKLSKIGINLDINSAGSIHNSLRKYLPVTPQDHFDWLRSAVLYNLCSRPMKRALYFNSNSEMDENDLHHFALNAPLYTHFTSPIRRYADVMVHRLLSSAIDYDPPPSWTPKFAENIAKTCNLKKYNAKLAGDQSGVLFLALYLEEHGPIVTQAGVFDVKDHSFDCVLYQFGINLRIYANQSNGKTAFSMENGIPTLVVEWEENVKQTIQILSVVNIQISKVNKVVKVEGVLLPPL